MALLSGAVLTVSAVTWLALQRVDARLQDLHKETLSQVAQALDLSKRSADLATSAPYLLNQRSNYLIELEGAKLTSVLERVRDDWPDAGFGPGETAQPPVSNILDSMIAAVNDLVVASRNLDDWQAKLRLQTAELGVLRNIATVAITGQDEDNRLLWWSLQSMNADALNAANAGNLISVGEEQRHFLRQRNTLNDGELSDAQLAFLDRLERAVWGPTGVFELRRFELSSNTKAQNALFRIRHDANTVNDLAGAYAAQAELFLAGERVASSQTIQVARFTVLTISCISLALAAAAALYVSRYVTFNISRVSTAMVRLANGDRSSNLPRRLSRQDEIGDLFRSFRSFRANALRLDRSNKQLDQRNALFEKVFSNISDGIAIADPSGRVSALNPAFAKILDVSSEQQDVFFFVDWLRQSRFAQDAVEMNLKHDHRGFCELIASDGQVLELRASKLPDDGRVWLLADVTERRKMSDRLQQIDRIETLGKVAGDTAHDFANILSTIRTHSHLFETNNNPTENLNAINNAVDFGTSITERLLAFARKQSLVPELIELNTLVSGMSDLVEIGLKPNVALEIEASPTPLQILADPGHLESALFNLVLNANNAIETEGRIIVSLSQTNIDQARIMVSDDGIGMTTDVLERAIEPFFTTREVDGGTGLGLSIVYGFITQSGGQLQIDSKKDIGTQIEILLPLANTVDEFSNETPMKTVLLVEDDPATRAAIKKHLEAIGHSVSACGLGEDAVSTLESSHFDLVLSDFDLGGQIDGISIVNAARNKSAATKTVLMSGKTLAKNKVPTSTLFLSKPVTRENLAKVLS